MTINGHRHFDAAVAVLALDVFRMFSLGDEETGLGIPKVMEPHSR